MTHKSAKEGEAATQDESATEPESPPLSVAFVKGWHSLPTELKLQVLSNIIPINQNIETYFLIDSVRNGENESGFVVDGMPHSRWMWSFLTIPAFSALALDSLFLNNTFCMWGVSDGMSNYERIPLPSDDIGDRVRHLKYSVTASDLGWKNFRAFARGELGFRNLHTLELHVYGGHGWPPWLDSFCEEIEMHGMVTLVNAKTVRVTYGGWRLLCWRTFDLDKLRALVETHVVGSEGAKE